MQTPKRKGIPDLSTLHKKKNGNTHEYAQLVDPGLILLSATLISLFKYVCPQVTLVSIHRDTTISPLSLSIADKLRVYSSI